MTLCLHCHLRPAYQGKRHLCLSCYRQGHIRKQYPAEVRQRKPVDGNCQHCGKYSPRLRPRRLCYVCYYIPDILARYPSDSKYAPRHDDYEVTMDVLDCYPDLLVLPPCSCGESLDGVCPRCEAQQRRQMPVQVPEPETADEIIAFVRELRRSCGGVMS